MIILKVNCIYDYFLPAHIQGQIRQITTAAGQPAKSTADFHAKLRYRHNFQKYGLTSYMITFI